MTHSILLHQGIHGIRPAGVIWGSWSYREITDLYPIREKKKIILHP